jgi:negative regulator of genetic competence, sporulation and motility
MEWIHISKNKLKVMLTAEDARRYELNCESADYADSITRAAFRDILTDVRTASGFDATEDKVYIQMYPSKEGGCELFITKTGLLAAGEETVQINTPKEAQKAQRRDSREKHAAIHFDTLDPLLALCRRLQSQEGIEKSEIWRDEGGAWWLLFTHSAGDIPFLGEYGKLCRQDKARLFLGEHGKAVCSTGAITVFAKF